MPRQSEAPLDEMLADPMVRALMAADRVDQSELKLLMRSVRQAIEPRDRLDAGEADDRLQPCRGILSRAATQLCVSAIRLVFGQEPQCAARS